MKVYIGPYKNWWGPYQIADLFKKVGVSEEKCDKLGELLSETWIMDFCNWIESKRKRTVKIRVDNYDTWNMDHTLSLIIVPMLKQLKSTKHGSPHVDDEDVPVELRTLNAPYVDPNSGDIDDLWHKRWEWVMDELIWTFEHHLSDEHQYDIATYKRIQNGFLLFGKYFSALWD
jgi:hypothetical protein